ncbi:YmaF family protein [Clostridium paraputrificum]|uniref:YmaF family protein n=1 Tax=Clostridium paraputrificum TaxID=29363 RepID=UPI003D33CEF5
MYSYDRYPNNNKCYNNCPTPEPEQRHNHEFLGSTKFAEECDDRHNHRFACISSEAIGPEASHVHKIKVNTDFFGHFHEICIITGPPIPVGCGKHVHLAVGKTTCEDGHFHCFIFTTLIEAPALP